MNRDGQVRFNALASSGDESEGEHAGRPTSPSEEEGEIRRKRFKVDAPPAPNPDMPKWSNPDPYSALPPTEHSGAPKKDIVQVIRKAKNNDAPRHDMTQAVAKNADFISFNFDDDFGDDHASTGQVNVMDDNSSEASSFTSKMSETAAQNFRQAANGEAMPSFGMKRPNRADASIGGRPPPIDLTSDDDDPRPRKRPHFSEPVDLTGDMGAPPAPPPGFVMPTDEELVQQYLGGQPKGRKRKHDEQSRGKGDVTDAWQANWTNSTPWRTVDRSQTADVGVRFVQLNWNTVEALADAHYRLHEEISDFFNFVRPHQYEEDIRNDLIDRVQAAVRSFGGDSKNVDIRCFGSFAAGIYLPTADMDLVALSRSFMHHGQKSFCQTGSKLYKLLQHLIRAGIAQAHTTSAVPRAKVPIVKFTDRKTGIKVDISFENDSGLLANSTFKEWKTQYPAMPVVVVLIKQMLAMRDLNEVFTGGLGGFSIICLVVSMMQRMSDDQYYKTSQNPDYGSLLLKFLDDYGNKFDMRSTGIVMDPPGLYDKIRNPKSFQNASNLTIIDPNNPNNDISGGSREVHAVFEVFRKAHAHIVQLMAKVHAGKDAGDSFLGCVIGGNYSSFIRQRNKLYKLHGGDNGSPSPEPIVNDQPTPQKRKRGPTRNHDPPSKNVRTNSGQIAATSGGPLAGRVSGGPQNKKGYADLYLAPSPSALHAQSPDSYTELMLSYIDSNR